MQKNQPFLNIFNTFFIKNWLVLFTLTLCSYSHFIFYFLWGNHDWAWVQYNTPLLSGLFEGRFSQFILQTITSDGVILPIFSLFLSFGFYSLSSFLLLKLFKLPENKTPFLLVGLFITTSPYTLSWLYFAFITLSCLSWPFFIILAFVLLSDKPQNNRPIISKTFATIFFLLAIGGYPPVINLISTIFFFIIINDICFNKLTIKNITKKYIPTAFSILLALISVLVIQHYLRKYNLQQATYNTAQLNFTDFPQKLYDTFIISLKQFITTKSFIGFSFKYLNLCLVFLALLTLYIQSPKNIIHLSLLTLCIIGTLLSTVLTTLVAENVHYVTFEPRIEFFGLLYVYAFSMIVLLKTPNKFLKNITYIACFSLVLININTLSYASKVWNLGFKSEALLSNRIINNIEKNKTFNPIKKYTFIQGGTTDFRSRFYTPQNQYEQTDSYTLTAPYVPWHLPSKAYKFYTPTDFFGKDFDIFWRYIHPSEILITNNLYQYLSQNATPWPQNNAIFIDENTIILTLSHEGKHQGYYWINSFY
jgi:hypothetical protein